MEHEQNYPSYNGIIVPPFELELPEADTDKLTNHHGAFFKRLFGHTALHGCFRNLDCNQWQLPDNQHQWLHDEYGPVRVPTPSQMWYQIHTAQERDGNHAIRGGSAFKPVYEAIAKERMDKIDRAYHKLK